MFFALAAVLASEVGYTGKTIDRKRLAPETSIYPVPATLPMGFYWAMFFCQDVTDHCTLAGSADFAVLARGANCTNVQLARLIAGAQKVGLDVHGAAHATGSADVFGFVVFPANAHSSGTGKRISRIRSIARTVSSRRRISGRAMQLVSGHESFCRSATVGLSQFLMQVSSSRGRLIWFQESLCQLCVWSEGHLEESYVFPAVIGVFAGLISICTDA